MRRRRRKRKQRRNEIDGRRQREPEAAARGRGGICGGGSADAPCLGHLLPGEVGARRVRPLAEEVRQLFHEKPVVLPKAALGPRGGGGRTLRTARGAGAFRRHPPRFLQWRAVPALAHELVQRRRPGAHVVRGGHILQCVVVARLRRDGVAAAATLRRKLPAAAADPVRADPRPRGARPGKSVPREAARRHRGEQQHQGGQQRPAAVHGR